MLKDYERIVDEIGGEFYRSSSPQNCERLHAGGTIESTNIVDEMEYEGYRECPECGRRLDR